MVLVLSFAAGCRSDKLNAQAHAVPELAAWIGEPWDEAWNTLAGWGVERVISGFPGADDPPIVRHPGKGFGNVRFHVSATGKIDEVEAWAVNGLAPFFSTVAGPITPGVAVEEVETKLGEPVYVEYGRHGLRMKGWLAGDYLVFVESNNGMFLTPEAGRVKAFRRDALPAEERMPTLKGRTTLAALARGERYVGKAPGVD